MHACIFALVRTLANMHNGTHNCSYIAVEFAGIFSGLGGDTHLMYRADKVLRGFDEECRAQVTENLGKRDIKVCMLLVALTQSQILGSSKVPWNLKRA